MRYDHIGDGWKPSPGNGICPDDARGKRVRVGLRQGGEPDYSDPPYPPGWAADGRGGLSWLFRGDFAFDVAEYLVL